MQIAGLRTQTKFLLLSRFHSRLLFLYINYFIISSDQGTNLILKFNIIISGFGAFNIAVLENNLCFLSSLQVKREQSPRRRMQKKQQLFQRRRRKQRQAHEGLVSSFITLLLYIVVLWRWISCSDNGTS